jgi:acetoin utilization protein AcuB
MIKDPITVSERTSVQEAIRIMQENGIRHLPVVDRSDKLLGWATFSDMRQGLLPAVVTGLSLGDLMVRNPITLHPDDDVETAARTIFEKKIGGLPVVNDDNVVLGVITVTDILGAFIRIMGILASGSRLEVNVGNEPKGFEGVSRIIHDQGGDIISVGINPDMENGKVYYFRLQECPIEPIAKALQDEGYEVLSFST